MSCLSSLIFLRANCLDIKVMVLSFWHLYELSFTISDIILSWPVNVILCIIQELSPVSDPSNDSWNCEENRVHVSWESHRSVNESTVKIDIWIQFSCDKVFIFQSNFFQLQGNFNQGFFSTYFKDFESNLKLIKKLLFWQFWLWDHSFYKLCVQIQIEFSFYFLLPLWIYWCFI